MVSSGEEAYRILKEETFDLILYDIRLPGESGMDLITQPPVGHGMNSQKQGR